MNNAKKNMSQSPSNKRSPVALIIGLGLFISGVMGYALFTGSRMTQRYAPLIDAAMEIKLEAAIGHLWFEEAISGDRTKQPPSKDGGFE